MFVVLPDPAERISVAAVVGFMYTATAVLIRGVQVREGGRTSCSVKCVQHMCVLVVSVELLFKWLAHSVSCHCT